MFKMLKETQARAALGDKLEMAEQLQKTLGMDSLYSVYKLLGESVEGFNPSQFQITPDHYSEWLNALHDEASAQGIDVSQKAAFMDFAHEMLDNDPRVDELGLRGNNAMLQKIVSTLWASQKASKAHAAVTKGVDKHIAKAREEEEALSQLVQDTVAPPVKTQEEEESGFSQMMKAAVGMEDEGASCAMKNPHPRGSLRHSLWNDINKTSEEEEFDDLDAEMGGEGEGELAGDEELPPPSDELPNDMEADAGEGDLEQRIADLEDRLSDVEAEVEHAGDDAAAELDAGSDISLDKEEPAGDVDAIAAKITADPKPEYSDEEAVKNLFHRAITAPKEHMTQALKDVEEEGRSAWMKLQLPKNPHPRKSAAHKAWTKGMTAAARDALGLQPKPVQNTSKPKPKAKR